MSLTAEEEAAAQLRTSLVGLGDWIAEAALGGSLRRIVVIAEGPEGEVQTLHAGSLGPSDVIGLLELSKIALLRQVFK